MSGGGAVNLAGGETTQGGMEATRAGGDQQRAGNVALRGGGFVASGPDGYGYVVPKGMIGPVPQTAVDDANKLILMAAKIDATQKANAVGDNPNNK